MEYEEQLARLLEEKAVEKMALIKGEVSKALDAIAEKYNGLDVDGLSPAENLGRLLFTTDSQVRARVQSSLKLGLKGQMIQHMLSQSVPAATQRATKKKAAKKKASA